MKTLLLVLALGLAYSTFAYSEEPIFYDRVEMVYYDDGHGAVTGYTRLAQGLPGTSTQVGEDVWVKVYENWIVIELKTRKWEEIVPRERVRRIVVGNQESNKIIQKTK